MFIDKEEKETVKTINLNFEGYWRDVNKSGIPENSGLYAVYVFKYNKPEKEGEKGTVTLERLIYFGEAENVNERMSNHEKEPEWQKRFPRDRKYVSLAGATSPDRERAECALIFHHKPKCNDECKYSFPYEETTVVSEGRNALIDSPITVKKTV